MLVSRWRKRGWRGFYGRAVLTVFAAVAAAVLCVAGAVSVSAAPAAPRTAGTVLAWGDNQFGELGDARAS